MIYTLIYIKYSSYQEFHMFEDIVTNLYIKILVFLFAKIYKNLQELF